MDTKKDVNNEQIVEVKTEKTQIIQYDAKMNPGQNQAISSKERGFEGSSKKTKKSNQWNLHHLVMKVNQKKKEEKN